MLASQSALGDDPREDVKGLPARYHTIVIGAGPAGVMAATHAAERGAVLLVESAVVPRDKSCGGMLNEYAQHFLGELAPIPGSLVLEPAHVHFRYVDWDRNIKKPTGLRFLNVDRKAFDHWLLTLLPDNVELADGTSLDSLDQDGSGVRVRLRSGKGTSSATCHVLVGADGARSHVRRTLGAGSVATYVTLQDWVELRGDLPAYFDCIYMRDVGDNYAYSYVVPKSDLAIVGSVYYPRTKRPHLKQDQTMGLLRAALPQLGETRRREASAALAVRSGADVVPGGGRILLAGEAGGYMSPTSGEGISYALNTGRLAGRAIAACEDPREASARYARDTDDIRRNISRKLKWLPFMESNAGKRVAGYVPDALVSRVTRGL